MGRCQSFYLLLTSLEGICAPEFAKEKPIPNVRTAPAKTLLAACYLAVLMVSSCVEHRPGISLFQPRPHSLNILPCLAQAFFHLRSHLYAHWPCPLSAPPSLPPRALMYTYVSDKDLARTLISSRSSNLLPYAGERRQHLVHTRDARPAQILRGRVFRSWQGTLKTGWQFQMTWWRRAPGQRLTRRFAFVALHSGCLARITARAHGVILRLCHTFYQL